MIYNDKGAFGPIRLGEYLVTLGAAPPIISYKITIKEGVPGRPILYAQLCLPSIPTGRQLFV